MKALIALAFISATLAAAPAMASIGADPNAPNAFAGTSRQGFYGVEQRMDDIEGRIRALGPRGSRGMADMRQIRAFVGEQMARHGELRDWDRETINVRLNRLVGRYGLG